MSSNLLAIIILTMRKPLKINPGVKAIVPSGYAEESAMAEYRGYGFRGMVAKPYTLEQLGKAVQDLIGRSACGIKL